MILSITFILNLNFLRLVTWQDTIYCVISKTNIHVKE